MTTPSFQTLDVHRPPTPKRSTHPGLIGEGSGETRWPVPTMAMISCDVI